MEGPVYKPIKVYSHSCSILGGKKSPFLLREYKLERHKSYLFQELQEHKMTHLLSILETMPKPGTECLTNTTSSCSLLHISVDKVEKCWKMNERQIQHQSTASLFI